MSIAGVVTGLAELGCFAGEEIIVVASVRLMTDGAVLGDRRMLKGKRSSLLRMALVTEVGRGIGLHHLVAEASVSRVAVRALHLALGDRMVRLSLQLIPHVLVARDAKIRLARLQAVERARMNGVALVAGDA
jgi:hypothetical protein